MRTCFGHVLPLLRERKAFRAGFRVLGGRIAALVILLSMTGSGVAAPPDSIADCSFLFRALKNDTNDAVHCTASGWKRPLHYSDEGSLSLYLYVGLGPPLGRRLYVNRQRDGDLLFLRAGREPGWPASEYAHFKVFERGGLSAWVFPFKKAESRNGSWSFLVAPGGRGERDQLRRASSGARRRPALARLLRSHAARGGPSPRRKRGRRPAARTPDPGDRAVKGRGSLSHRRTIAPMGCFED